ncbi:hypothetical protein GLOIN_2v1792152 [Rhizophagus clarus]|uniref:Uncharacterized protein n=1 Tax=Rhizophagus clarus TaxID=94130 RepID=A0A8H3MD69_9GLOM|nr:hypothetical protein GLOIN_2v1792152 [Rhizophagus clarus]
MLMEREKWPTKGLILDCSKCKEKYQDSSRIFCHARQVMFLEPDFLAQKFHCKLNFIERYWDADKRYTCENCDHPWEGLQKIVSESLDSISLINIRKFSRKCWRYMDLYRKGIDGKLVEYAMKKYKSHRKILKDVLEELNKLG